VRGETVVGDGGRGGIAYPPHEEWRSGDEKKENPLKSVFSSGIQHGRAQGCLSCYFT